MASNGSLRNVKGTSENGTQKYGLFIRDTKSAKPQAKTGTQFSLGKKLSVAKAFNASDSDSDSDKRTDQGITSFGGSSSSSASAAAKAARDEQKRVNLELRAVQAKGDKRAEEAHKKALQQDASVFDYDGVYDSLKEKEIAVKKGRDNPDGGAIKKPRYMEALIKASAQRKIDLERAELRKVQREREEEGEEFGDKEKFVTGAYKQQMADLKKIEEEEKRREAMEKDVTKGGDLTSFYRDILNQRDPTLVVPKAKEEQAVVKIGDGSIAADRDTSHDRNPTEADDEDEAEAQRTKDAIAKGLIQVNDSNEVVDKRQLLVGGLNVSSRYIKRQQQEKEERDRIQREREAQEQLRRAEEQKRAQERNASREQHARAREMVLRQQREKEDESKKRKEMEREELEKKLARKTTEDTVSDARARYLARKKAQPVREESDSD
ncbi:coiled-coil domain-containing protein 55-domain containing protein [Fimicolochytrium jonesii]|uniref:coiled-coil domain-containing protein 55-domain containing protein n=1 Tax=Fimicolochytrium jonesii TaxID=1396493 RepID=UPI0022FEC1AA|nr:coiled-coil domain-containing protein 55-domain containing protein [Fimicolochytrium jonesii]KAI8821375.1 coiled-coil domain-containing protein 55-domain containing protein [Fimicolochytrium jonesii]